MLALLALFPLAGATFYTELVTKMMILAIFALSLDLLVGYTGLVSFGHAAFFGVGAYALGLLAPKYEAASLWLDAAGRDRRSPGLRRLPSASSSSG